MSNSQDNEIKEKLAILKELNKELDNFDNFTNILVNNTEDYQQIMEDIHPRERMDLNWNLGFSTYSLYHSMILINGLFNFLNFSIFEVAEYRP